MNSNSSQQFLTENPVFQFILSPKYRWIRHFILISVLGLVLYYSSSEVSEPMLVLLLFLLIFYVNMYVLVPKFLFKNNNLGYFISVLGILGFSIFSAKMYVSYFDSANSDGLSIPLFSILILVLISASTSIKIFPKWMMDKQLIYELEKSKISTELDQLKNQINPHFLFNMLNNANVLTKKDPEKASQVLMKLSDLLRYQLYDSAREKVLLTSDIHFLEDFLNLEKIRRDNFDFLISKEGDLNGVLIPPLLFISFVENAVKHNNDASKLSYVHLFFEMKNGELIFKCINSKPLQKNVFPNGGLGLSNIKRRLELLFPSIHTLEIDENGETYVVNLKMKL